MKKIIKHKNSAKFGVQRKSAAKFSARKKSSPNNRKFEGVKEEKLYTAIYRLSNDEGKTTLADLWDEYGVLKRKNAKKASKRKIITKKSKRKK